MLTWNSPTRFPLYPRASACLASNSPSVLSIPNHNICDVMGGWWSATHSVCDVMARDVMTYLGLRVLCDTFRVYYALHVHVDQPQLCQDTICMCCPHALVTPRPISISPIHLFCGLMGHTPWHEADACHTFIKECMTILCLHQLAQCLLPHRPPIHSYLNTSEYRSLVHLLPIT